VARRPQKGAKRSRTTLGDARAVSCQITVVYIASRADKNPSVDTAHVFRQHKRRGGEDSEEGDRRLPVVVMPLVGIVPCPLPAGAPNSHRRIPASCPFPRSACHQLRVALIPLAISVCVRKHRFMPSSSPNNGGENDNRHDRAYGISCLTRPTTSYG
jgi:hypothetical protein